VIALCQMTGLTRAGFHRVRTPRLEPPVEMEVGDEMQKIALDSAAYGYRRKAIYIQSLRRRGSLLAGILGMSTGVEWKSVAGFQELSENNACRTRSEDSTAAAVANCEPGFGQIGAFGTG